MGLKLIKNANFLIVLADMYFIQSLTFGDDRSGSGGEGIAPEVIKVRMLE